MTANHQMNLVKLELVIKIGAWEPVVLVYSKIVHVYEEKGS
jgi:hypothetical protein